MIPLVGLASVVAFVTGIFLSILLTFPNLLTLSLVLPIWLAFLFIADYVLLVTRGRRRVFPLAASFALSGTLFMSAIDHHKAAWLSIALVAGGLGLLYALATVRGALLPPAQKRIRRFLVAMWTWSVYAFFTGHFALIIFFPSFPWWLLSVFAAAFAAYAAGMIWREYEDITFTGLFTWLVVVGVAAVELLWVLTMLPFDYFVSGFLAAWVWYLLQLFVRFHVSRQGILWQKHLSFLLLNGILMIVFLVFVARLL